MRNPRQVTVREVAERAGVSHALVHQYVGTKTDLFDAVMQRVAVDREAFVSQTPSLDEALRALFAQVLENRLHTMSQVRSAMDGVEYVSLKRPLETGRLLVELARATATSGGKPTPTPRDIDPRVMLAATTAMAVSMCAVESWLYPIFELDLSEKEEVNRQLGEIVTYLVNLVLAWEGESAAG